MLIEQVTFSRAAVGVRIVTASELLFNQCEATGPGSDRVTSRSGCATTKESTRVRRVGRALRCVFPKLLIHALRSPVPPSS